ncbi:MAG: response regulator [Rhizobacter sp.]|nr:response regulator [Ferruginibacter sp.]
MPDTAANALKQKIKELETENAMLRRDFNYLPQGDTVRVPPEMRPLFDVAQQTVNEYFRHLKMDPTQGTIEINDQRYVLVRASALSKDFLETVQNLYADRGESEALSIGKNFLFDIAHVIGINDAKNFHEKMNLTDPIAKLSAGTVHFAYSGWAFVDILPESNPTPGDNFFLAYNHPYSFEADSWKRAGKKTATPVCIMNAGYSSGWCQESFNLPLTAVEVTCTARGDEHCTFIMATPQKIQGHLEKFHAGKPYKKTGSYEVPTFFDRKRVEEEMQRSRVLAEESAKSKSDFIANISHELRTPLGVILGFTDLLKKTSLTTVQKDYLEAVNSSGNSLMAIINDILDLSKIDAGKFIIEKLPFSITELLHSVEIMFAGKAQQKQIEFECMVSPGITFLVEGDPMRLTQILINLIGNAVKFTEAGGVYLTCALKKEEAHRVKVEFTVRDTGIGIDEKKTATIFERFSQGDTDTTRKYGGTGLGLAITKQLIELQGGEISFTSEPGKGTEFRFSISYDKSSFHKNETVTTAAPDNTFFGSIKKILVVEDNLMNQKLASVILMENGFDIAVAENGEHAISILKTTSFDIILMDLQMPLMDGYQCTNLVRNELYLSTPIIAMTAHALSGEKEKCIRAGMNDYISKPYKAGDLLAKIGQFQENKRTVRHTDTGSIIDLGFLRSQTKNNEKFIGEMIGIFIKQHPKDLATLQSAISAGDHQLIYKTTHTLRNTVAFFGLQKLVGDPLMEMEKLARNNMPVEKIATLFLQVEPVCGKALQELQSLHDTMPG